MPSRRVIVILLLATCARAAWAARITVAPAAAPAGGSAIQAVTFAAEGDNVAGVQFDIVYDPTVASVAVTAADALRSAGKSLYQAPLGPQGIRVLIAGLNQNTIADGPLINLTITLKPDTTPGSYPVVIASALAAGPAGDSVSLASADGAISITPLPTVMPAVPPAGILSAAGLSPGPVAPGELITLMGSGLAQSGSAVSVLFDGYPAPLLYSGATQINVVVPYKIAGSTATQLQVVYNGWLAVSLSVPVAAAAPAIFTLDSSGTGNAAALNQDGTVNGSSNPAQPGSVVTLFASGAGQTDPPGVDGQIATAALPKPLLPVSVQIAGQPAEVLYAGAAPGLIAGVLQVNCRVPAGTPAGAVPVSLKIGQFTGGVGVTLAID